MRDERTASTCRQPNPDQTKADHLHGKPSAVSAHRVPVDPKRPPGLFAKRLVVTGVSVRRRRVGCQLSHGCR
jgi:hypothetical protein